MEEAFSCKVKMNKEVGLGLRNFRAYISLFGDYKSPVDKDGYSVIYETLMGILKISEENNEMILEIKVKMNMKK